MTNKDTILGDSGVEIAQQDKHGVRCATVSNLPNDIPELGMFLKWRSGLRGVGRQHEEMALANGDSATDYPVAGDTTGGGATRMFEAYPKLSASIAARGSR
eukprot:15288689-Alexandrium_andersonii.AAC.1